MSPRTLSLETMRRLLQLRCHGKYMARTSPVTKCGLILNKV
jgi:hypothetical protein